jgi:hypothetical protein
MSFVSWVILIGLLLLIGSILKRGWEARMAVKQTLQEAATTPTENSPASDLPMQFMTAITGPINGLRQQLFGHKQAELVIPFRTWMEQALLGEPALRHWLATLSDDQLALFTKYIDAFCREMGFELSWLVNQDLRQNPALAQAVTQVVATYCRACQQAVVLQEELEAYKALRSYEQNPNAPRNRDFGQALFGKLLEQGLVSINIADHLALPERQRRREILLTIQKTASQKQEAFNQILKEVVTHHHAPVAGATIATPEVASVAPTHKNGVHPSTG